MLANAVQELVDGLGVKWAGEVEALGGVGAFLDESKALLVGLDTFGDRRKTEVFA